MNLETLEKLLFDSVAGIKLCSEAKLNNSSLVLLYCGIEMASSLDLEYDKMTVQLRYTKWCDTYMFKGRSYEFTSLELYAARCGVIHEMSSESALSAKGKTRRIYYAWGDSKVDMLREMNELAKFDDCVAIQFEDLVQAYESGLNEFLASLRSNKQRAHFAIEKATNCFVTTSDEEMKSLLKWGKSKLGLPIS